MKMTNIGITRIWSTLALSTNNNLAPLAKNLEND